MSDESPNGATPEHFNEPKVFDEDEALIKSWEEAVAESRRDEKPPTSLRETAGSPWVIVPAGFVPPEDPYKNPADVVVLSFEFGRDEYLVFLVVASIVDDPKLFDGLLAQIREAYAGVLPESVFKSMIVTDRRQSKFPTIASTAGDEAAVSPRSSGERDRNETKGKSENLGRRQKPEIVVTDQQLGELTHLTITALYEANSPPTLYVRSGELVRLRCDEKGKKIIESLTDSMLRKHMSDAADFYKESRNGQTAITPPMFVAKNILALEGWDFPPLSCVVEIPVLRSDGSIIDRAGYDKTTGVYYWPDQSLKIPSISKCPSREDVELAKGLVMETIGDFPYVDEASRANAMALLLTPLVRQAIQGVVPIALIDAVNQGTGKSLFSDVVSLIPTGRTASMATMPGSEEEWRKRFTSELYSGTTLIFIDNIAGRLDSPTLASVITAWNWTDRWLGANKMVDVPNRATWIGNGNNIQLGGDMQRRAYWIRMDAKSPTPWRDREFKHPDLIPWVTKNRGRLIAALLTLARAWYAADRPASGIKPLGRFEEWSQIVTGVLAYAGVQGCLGNLAEMYDTVDEESGEWERFLRLLEARYGARAFTTAEIVQSLPSSPTVVEALPTQLAEFWSGPDKRLSFNKRLGNAFREREKRRFGPSHHRIERTGASRGAVDWCVLSERPVESGVGGEDVARR